MKSSARGLAERLYDAGHIARSRRGSDRKNEPIIQIEAADMIMTLVCRLHRVQRVGSWWKVLALTTSTALTAIVELLS